MPSITLTLTDTPSGAVSILSNFKPAVGNPCSPAQAHALDIIGRTRKLYGMQWDALPDGVDIAAMAEPMRAFCSCDLTPTQQEIDAARCMACGKAL
ncbi:MAG: hypothetical protein ACYC4S_00510 [Rhodoferax sp.]